MKHKTKKVKLCKDRFGFNYKTRRRNGPVLCAKGTDEYFALTGLYRHNRAYPDDIVVTVTSKKPKGDATDWLAIYPFELRTRRTGLIKTWLDLRTQENGSGVASFFSGVDAWLDKHFPAKDFPVLYVWITVQA